MRIIAGDARGRKLVAPPGRDTRPILDSLKESLFNIIQDEVPDAFVWDLFSGPGSMGLEALSRGARGAVFVDRGRAAVDALRKNIKSLSYGDRCTVSTSDVFRFRSRPELPKPNIIFFDPPFPLVLKETKRVEGHLNVLAESLADDGLLMYRSPTESKLEAAPEGLILEDQRVKGVNAMHFIRLEKIS